MASSLRSTLVGLATAMLKVVESCVGASCEHGEPLSRGHTDSESRPEDAAKRSGRERCGGGLPPGMHTGWVGQR